MQKLKISVKNRMWLLSGVLILVIIINGLLAILNSSSLIKQLDLVSKTELPAIRHVTVLDTYLESIMSLVLRSIIFYDHKESLEEIESSYEEYNSKIKNGFIILGSLHIKGETQDKITLIQRVVETYLKDGLEIIDFIKNKKKEKMNQRLTEFMASAQNLRNEFEKIGNKIEKDTEEISIKSDEIANRTVIFSILLIILGCIVGVLISFWLIHELVKSMKEVTSSLSNNAGRLTVSAEQIKVSSKTLSDSTNHHSSAIEETAASMEEITSMMSQTLQNAGLVVHEIETGKQEMAKGNQVVNLMVEAMEQIQLSNQKLGKIVKIIGEINEKTKIINDIAFETKLLSFNASIEAARAGSYGKGFSVVAEEVGKLALVSSKAANEVRNLLETSVADASDIVNDTKDKVNTGQNISKECEHAFLRMAESLEKISTSVQLITSATKEQEMGVKQTNQAIMLMDKVTQTESQNAEELASQAASLSHAAYDLDHYAHSLLSIIFGEKASKKFIRQEAKKHASSPEGLTDHNLSKVLPMIKKSDEFSSDELESFGDEKENHVITRADSRWRSTK